MKKLLSVILVFVMLFSFNPISATTVSAAYQIPPNMQWWSEARFGMFIHFGSYSYLGKGEWAMQREKISKEEYQTTVSAKFNPTAFNAKTIVNYAKKAGMKYLVITAKHHEGLAMWDTKVDSFKDYTGTKIYSLQSYTPFGSTGRDVLMELKKECKKAGIKFGLYYSIMDWSHSSQTIENSFTKMASMEARDSYIKDMKAQLQELVTIYDPAIMWFDGDWTFNDGAPTLSSWWTKADGQDLYDYLKGLSPNMLINERVCRSFGLGDYECAESSIPFAPLSRPWETNITMNGAWGYTKSNEKTYKPIKKDIQQLVTVVSEEGNFLLNIGPKGDGTMDSGSKDTLTGMGKWMKIYSDSIYGTIGSPFTGKSPKWGKYTLKGKKLYAHVFNWPTEGKLEATAMAKSKIKRIYLLNDSKKTLKYTRSKDIIKIAVPKAAPNEYDSVIVIEYSSIAK